MSKKIILLLTCCCCINIVWAQEMARKQQYQFHSIFNAVLVNGDKGETAAVQTVNGFSKGPLFAGIGVGLDYCQYRTVPVFADLRYAFGQKKNKFFLYGDLGVNCSWVQDKFHKEPTNWNGGTVNNFNNGLYTDVGLGLSAACKNGDAFLLSLGYSKKSLVERISHTDSWSGRELEDVNKYRFNRILVKLGFRF